ncbi:MAG: response regulator transcription factor [Bacteroidales bacterium]|nr:response regulator transcription factor [Bacteroidales bacterium]MBN2747926.1 response regulator transcription factor [Bacteroidales bacterium]
MLRAVLVDDEVAAIRSLELLLSQVCSDVEVVAVARSGEEALDVVRHFSPDVVFLDIEMPKGSGFDFLQSYPDRTFDVIFITAYNQYAIKAFRFSAVDYILKPIDIDDLERAVGKVRESRKSQMSSRARYYALFENLKSVIPFKLALPNLKGGLIYIDIREVVCFASVADATSIITINDSEVRTTKTLSELESLIDDKHFFRISHDMLINLRCVKEFQKNKGVVQLEGNYTIPVPPDRREMFVELLLVCNKRQE